MGWEITSRPPYNLDIAPSDFHLFGPMNVRQGGLKFLTDNGCKSSVLNWLGSQSKIFHAAGTTDLAG
jgi:hypothetical protein